MEIIKVFLNAIIAGFNRLIPVSHNGHEKISEFLYVNLQGGGNDTIFPLVIKLAVIISIVYFLKDDLIRIFKAIGNMAKDIIHKQFKLETKDEDKNTVLMLVFAVVVFIFTPVFTKLFSSMLDNFLITSMAFLISGIFLYMADNIKEDKLSKKNEVPFNALSVGFFKVLSVIPGFSGIGGMYFSCMINGFTKDFSLKFTYIVTLAATLISFTIDIIGLFSGVTAIYNVFGYILAFAGALVTSGIAIYIVNLAMKKNHLKYFGFYNILIAVFVLLIWLRG